jgi:hypothetical protein
MKARYSCCGWATRPTYFTVPGVDVSVAVYGSAPYNTVLETELLAYTAEKVKPGYWNVSFGKNITLKKIQANSEDAAFHKARWYMNQLSIAMEKDIP